VPGNTLGDEDIKTDEDLGFEELIYYYGEWREIIIK
jgi:hypothetical protein